MAEVRQEASAPRPVRICRLCVHLVHSPAAVEPCGHVFCQACIQPRAAAEAAATCPVCQGPIGAVRLLPGQESGAGPAAGRRRRRLHPFVLRWLQRQQQEAAPGGGWCRIFPDGDRAPSPPGARQRGQRVLEELDRNGPGQEKVRCGHRGSRGELAQGTTCTSSP